MTVYRCLIRGENFPVLSLDSGERALLGFFTTRFVEADDEEQAEQVGLDLLRGDEWLQSLKANASPEDPPATIYFDEIEQVEDKRIEGAVGGFSFFPMEERDQSESECKT